MASQVRANYLQPGIERQDSVARGKNLFVSRDLAPTAKGRLHEVSVVGIAAASLSQRLPVLSRISRMDHDCNTGLLEVGEDGRQAGVVQMQVCPRWLAHLQSDVLPELAGNSAGGQVLF